MARETIVLFRFSDGYQSDLLSTDPSFSLRKGSENVLVTGAGLLKPFKGLTLVPSIQATGSIQVANKTGLTGKTIIVNGVTYTFETATNTGTNIQYDAGDTLAQIAKKVEVKLNASTDPLNNIATYDAGTTDTVGIVFDAGGAAGNAFTLVSGTAGTRIVMSGATLTGGVNQPEGSRVHFLTDNGYAGLGYVGDTGVGSVAKQIDLLFFIGSGQLRVNGEEFQIDGDDVEASSNWSYLTRSGGTFNTNSEIFQVGHPQPDRPLIFAKTPPNPGQKVMNAAVTVCIWRADTNTGQPSLPSPSSEILTVTNGSVIVQFPNADNNGQDIWGIGVTLPGLADLGNLYQLPTELGGEVTEAQLAYTRNVSASVTSGDTTVSIDVLTPVEDQFTNNDLGRRLLSTTPGIDSWITEITDPFTVEIFDDATATLADDVTSVTHAVDGILRAVEISWADTDLFGQALAPFDGFEPPDGAFAGNLMDTFYIEDVDGTIYYSIPNYFSFPPSRRIFTEDRATVYVDTGYGYHWRIAKQSISQIFYAAGEKPIQAMLKSKNAGCKYPQNACLGFGGRLMVWTGRPAIIDADGRMNAEFHLPVASEFEGWEDQTEEQPVVPAYDPLGLYELWCYGQKIMAIHAPTGNFCAPIDISEWTDGNIVSAVIVEEKLRLIVEEDNELVEYIWNEGAGSRIVIQSYFRTTPLQQAVITLLNAVLKPGTTTNNFAFSIIKNYADEIDVGTLEIAATPVTQVADVLKTNIRGVSQFALKIVGGTNEDPIDGNAAVEFVEVSGDWSNTP